MNRRQFITWMGIGGLASYLPVALVACSQDKKQSEGTKTPDNWVAMGTVTELEQKGQLSQEDIVVIASPSDPKTVIAVNSVCPHAGCGVTWDQEQSLFVCPCHHSQFDSLGKVIKGPAEQPLTAYSTKLEGGTILVQKA